MKVLVKKLHPDAKIPYKTYDEDFCYDCVAVSCEEVAPNVYKYGLGLAFQIQDDEQDLILSIGLRPRSSVWKTGMVLSNCVGTIDQLYTGEVAAVFYHVMPNMPKYEVGDRIGQIYIDFTTPIEFVETDTLADTARGAGGYGHTGR